MDGSDHAAVREAVVAATDGHGADAVFVCAGGTDVPFMDQAIDLVRYRGRVVIVGNVRPTFEREPFFQKEAEVLISRAGGPGRYDPQYEAGGIDYPYGLVRWTEGRNMAEYLRLVAAGLVQVDPLITHRFPAAAAPSAYRMLEENHQGTMAVLLDWERKDGSTHAGTQG
jgi:NADPH2:quinone reductase